MLRKVLHAKIIENIELLGGSAISKLTFKNSFDQDAQIMFFIRVLDVM
jgi:hypothetical protein